MQGIELRIQQFASLLEMSGRRFAVSLPILHYSQHGVRGGIFWTQLQQMNQQGHCSAIPCLVLNLSCPRKGPNAVWRNPKCLLKGPQSLFAVAVSDIGDPLQNPQLGIVRRCLESGTTQRNCLLEFAVAQGRANRLGLAFLTLSKGQRMAGEQNNREAKFPV